MQDVTDLSIRIESPLSNDVRHLVERSECALTDEERARMPVTELEEPNSEFIVARLNGQPVGCIALLDRLRYGEVRRLYVDEAARGHGIAAALVTALEAAAKDIGLRQVRIHEPNGARRTFSRMGFRASESTTELWLEKTL